jgi:hypothetical protein
VNENGQRALDAEIARRLERERPIPPSDFRERLRRELISAAVAPSPRRLGLLAAAAAGAGSLLLFSVAIGIVGLGPLAGP